jgi:hypothetical protein
LTTAPEVQLNDNDKREAIKRVLHDLLIFKLQPHLTLGDVKPLLDEKAEELMDVIGGKEDELVAMKHALQQENYPPSLTGLQYVLAERRQARERFDRIRQKLPVEYNTPDIFDGIAAMGEKIRTQDLDLRNDADMFSLLEDAGFSPDIPGLSTLIDYHERVKALLTAYEPAWRDVSISDGVDRVIVRATRMRDGLEAIEQRAADAR